MDLHDSLASVNWECTEASLDEADRLRVHEIFKGLDTANLGAVSRRQVYATLEKSLKKCSLSAKADVIDELLDRMLEGDTHLRLSRFEELYMNYIVQAPSRQSVSEMVYSNTNVMDFKSKKATRHVQRSTFGGAHLGIWFDNNKLRLGWLIIYLLMNVAAFYLKYDEYCNRRPAAYALSGPGLCVARGMAQVCLLNSLLILLPLCRGLVQTLREAPTLRGKVPADDAISFHKLVGYNLVLSGMIHTIAQVYSFISSVTKASNAVWEQSQLAESGAFDGRPGLFDLLTTVPGWTGLILVGITLVATPYTLQWFRRANFNWFWYSHVLFYPFYLGVLAFHGIGSWLEPTQALYFITIPVIIFTIDRRNRLQVYAKASNAKIRSFGIDGDSVSICFDKPKTFRDHLPGMYLYLNIPELSGFEWHPFTITSAPEDDHLSLNIRAVGDWTIALHSIMQACNDGKRVPPITRLDGPFGSPCQSYLNYSVIVMIGAGIGITPFSSILRDQVYALRDNICMNCNMMNYDKYNPYTGECHSLEKLYFHWITGTQSSLGWFANCMNQVTELDTEKKIEIHNHLTQVGSTSSKEAMIVKIFQTLMHEMTDWDMISGLSTTNRTHFGRPNWDKTFQRMVQDHSNQTVGVFFCGPKALEIEIRGACAAYSVNKRSVKFEFHAELF